jgi:hypothetical protein
MRRAFRRRKVRIVAVAVLVPVLAVFGFGIYLASLSGDLPWQTDPTRISEEIEPFSGIEGFSAPTALPTRAATPKGATPASATSRAGAPAATPSR